GQEAELDKESESLETGKKVMEVPEELRLQCLQSVHDGALGAHLSPSKMWKVMRERYWGREMSKDINDFVCEKCKLMKPPIGELRVPMTKLPIPEKPWQIVGMDIVGPIVMQNGQKLYFFIAGCYFTKELVVSSLRSLEANLIIKKVHKLIIASKSTPELIISDQG